MSARALPDVLRALGIEARLRGRHFKARCPSPDHADADPSWGIRVDDPAHPHMCWSCKYAGNLVTLAADRLGVSYADAEKWLRGRMIEPTPSAVRVRLVEPWVREMQRPFGVVVGPTDGWVTPARAYVARRGITEAQVARWGLGYAAQGKLAGRIFFPAHDARGALANYTARTYVEDEKRFLNATREEGPQEGSLFGEDRWPPPGARRAVVVTEGPIDALAVERAVEVLPAVAVAALFGSTPHPIQVWKLATFPLVVVLTDADAAGAAAAAVILSATRGARALLPAGEDAASSTPGSVLAEVSRCLDLRSAS